jgi:hypothetical protein
MNETATNSDVPEVADAKGNPWEKPFILLFAFTFIFLAVCILGDLFLGMLR